MHNIEKNDFVQNIAGEPYFFENTAGKDVTVNAERYRQIIIKFLWPALGALVSKE